MVSAPAGGRRRRARAAHAFLACRPASGAGRGPAAAARLCGDTSRGRQRRVSCRYGGARTPPSPSARKRAASSPPKSPPSSKPSAPPGLSLDHCNAHKHFHLHPVIGGLIAEIGRPLRLCGPLACRSSRRGCCARIEPRDTAGRRRCSRRPWRCCCAVAFVPPVCSRPIASSGCDGPGR